MIRKLRVYFTGLFYHRDDKQCAFWKKKIAAELPECEIFDSSGQDPKVMEGNVDRSDVLLVYHPRPSIKTSSEILYAWKRKIPVIVVVPVDLPPEMYPVYPWLKHYATKVTDSFKEAAACIQQLVQDDRQLCLDVF